MAGDVAHSPAEDGDTKDSNTLSIRYFFGVSRERQTPSAWKSGLTPLVPSLFLSQQLHTAIPVLLIPPWPRPMYRTPMRSCVLGQLPPLPFTICPFHCDHTETKRTLTLW